MLKKVGKISNRDHDRVTRLINPINLRTKTIGYRTNGVK